MPGLQDIYSQAAFAEGMGRLIHGLQSAADTGKALDELAQSLRYRVDIWQAAYVKLRAGRWVTRQFVVDGRPADNLVLPLQQRCGDELRRWHEASGKLHLTPEPDGLADASVQELVKPASLLCYVPGLSICIFTMRGDSARFLASESDHLWRSAAVTCMMIDQVAQRNANWQIEQAFVEDFALRRATEQALRILRLPTSIRPKLPSIAPAPQVPAETQVQADVEAGRMRSLLALDVDMGVDERSAVLAVLDRSAEELDSAWGRVADPLISVDSTGAVTRLNQAAEALLDRRSQAVQGQTLQQLLASVGALRPPSMADPVAAILAAGGPTALPDEIVLSQGPLGERTLVLSGAPVRSDAGQLFGAVLALHDLGQDRVMQSRLEHSEKMRTLGQLAAGIAHDFNNLLTVIVGAAQAIKMLEGERLSARGRDFLSAISRSAGVATELTGKLSRFSRMGDRQFKTLSLRQVVRDAVDLMTSMLSADLRISLVDTATEDTIEGNAAAIQSAALNIGINGSHAMQQGGQLTVTLRNVTLSAQDPTVRQFSMAPGQAVELAIADTGSGIAPDLLQKIFEPFVTTKQAGAGTGLGLSMVYATVLDHRGAILVDSVVGRGSTFRIVLPLAPQPGAPAPQSADARPCKAADGGAACILIVDDEPTIRLTGQAMLEYLGHQVLTADSGDAAVKLYREHAGQIGLVLLDLNMPRMNGRDCLSQLKALDPGCRVLIASGSADEDFPRIGADPNVVGLLGKPFDFEDLRQKVEQALRSPAASPAATR